MAILIGKYTWYRIILINEIHIQKKINFNYIGFSGAAITAMSCKSLLITATSNYLSNVIVTYLGNTLWYIDTTCTFHTENKSFEDKDFQ